MELWAIQPLLNRVTWFLGDPAQDVIRLRDLCDEAYSRGASNYRSGPGTTSSSRVVRQRLAANRFTFCTVDGESSPWHESLSEKGTGKLSAGAVLRVKQLVVDLQAACCFALQAFTGMRVSELCGLRAGIDSKTGLPCDVELRLCPSGLNEEFILTSELSKGQRYPREMPWLLGSRRVGDTDLPIAVSAIILLDDLIRPYRALLQSDRLLVSLTSPSGLPKTSDGVMRMTGGRILRMYRDYLSEWIDLSGLPDESRHATSSNDLILWREKRGSSITTHRLRKTFALFVLSVHPDLLPAVKRQFHHVNMQITEDGYWGNSAPQIEPINSVSRQLTTRMLFRVTQGDERLGGKMGHQIESNIEELRALVAGLTTSAAWVKVNRVEENNIHANHSDHGGCYPVVASRMECWKRAGLRPIGRLDPNYKTRDATLCASCQCFTIHSDSIPFWRERYIASEVSVRTADARERGSDPFRVIRNRSTQARKLLTDLNIDPASLESEIMRRVHPRFDGHLREGR